jgi:hypothetical protein
MMERYSHIRMEAKRRAADDLSATDFEPGVAQNWAQVFGVHPCSETDFLGTLAVVDPTPLFETLSELNLGGCKRS